MTNIEKLQNSIKKYKEKGIDATSFTCSNHFFLGLCSELKIDAQNCINEENYGEVLVFGVKVITDLPLLTSSGND
jgi:hypothetical protein